MRWLTFGCILSFSLWPIFAQAQQAHDTHQVQSAQQVQPKRSRADEMLYGTVSPLASVVYFPFKFTLGTLGAVLGGVSGFATGGNERAAEGVWWPTTAGRYFITPAVLSGEEPFWPPEVRSAVEPSGLIDVEAYIRSHEIAHEAGVPNPSVSAPELSAADLEAIRSATQQAQAASEEAQLAAQAAERAAEKSTVDRSLAP